MRTKIQALTDRLLLLYVIAKGNEVGYMDGPFKLMKIPFMAELASTRLRVNTFNYSFYRWTYGPLTTEIYEDIGTLVRLGLSSPKRRSPSVTSRGEHVLNLTGDLFEENASIVTFVDEAIRNCAPLGFGALKALVYKQTVCVDGLQECTVAEAPTGSSVLMSIGNPESSFAITDDWTDTLWGHLTYTENDFSSLGRIQPLSVLDMVVQ